MKKIVVPALSVLMFVLAGCSKNDTPNVEYYEGPAIVKHSESGDPLLEVLNGVTIIASGIAEKGLEDGDLLWTGFYIEEEKQTKKDSIVVSGITYNKIDSTKAKPTTETVSDYTFPIKGAMMWLNHVENIWVFEFEQTAPDGQTFDYEMLYGKEESADYPTVYIRSKKINFVIGSDTRVFTRFGFDLSSLITEYADKTTNILTFNVKFLSGFDTDKKEIFTPFQQNPIKLKISEKPVEGTMVK